MRVAGQQPAGTFRGAVYNSLPVRLRQPSLPDKNHAHKKTPALSDWRFSEYGRGGWIRTNAWQDQNLLPYRLATPLYLKLCNKLCENGPQFTNLFLIWEALCAKKFVLKQPVIF